MKLLVIAVLGVLAATLLAAAVLHGYRQDQSIIRWFAGTGVAGKLDVLGRQPGYLLIEDQGPRSVKRVVVEADGTFVARLAPGSYRLKLPGDARSAQVVVPGGHCLDLVLDFRLPLVVLEVPGEGSPIPQPVG